MRLVDAYKPDAIPAVRTQKAKHEYQIDHLGKYFFIRTNSGGSSNFKLMKTEESNPEMKNWTDVIPHRNDVLFEGFELFNNYLVTSERIKGLSNLRIIDIKDNSEHYLDFGEETYTAGMNINPNANTDILRYSYTSLTTPASVIDYNMKTREKKLMKEQRSWGDLTNQTMNQNGCGQKPKMERWFRFRLFTGRALCRMELPRC